MSKIKFPVLIVLSLIVFVSVMKIQAQTEEGSSTTTTNTPYITVYKEEGFRGESEKFLIGEYNTLEDRWKDEISSVAITGPVRVTLYDKAQFGGRKVVLEQSTAKLGVMRGEAKSLVVEEFKCSYAKGFKDTMFEGDSREFRVGDDPNGWDDMQSIFVCGGIEVTVYDKANFQGNAMKIKTSRIDLGAFRKKVKSLKVVESAQ
jgi:hypothetical protein